MLFQALQTLLDLAQLPAHDNLSHSFELAGSWGIGGISMVHEISKIVMLADVALKMMMIHKIKNPIL